MKNLILPLLLLPLLFSCEDPAPPVVPVEDIKCIQLTDENGEPYGNYGSCDASMQWKNQTLTLEQRALLNYSDTIQLDSNAIGAFTALNFSPNPAKTGTALHFTVITDVWGQAYKLKTAIVDENHNLVEQKSYLLPQGSALRFADPALFNPGKYYRMYYRLESGPQSAATLEGYGNFLICNDYVPLPDNGNIEGFCF